MRSNLLKCIDIQIRKNIKNKLKKYSNTYLYDPCFICDSTLDEIIHLSEDGYYYQQIEIKKSCPAEINNPELYTW